MSELLTVDILKQILQRTGEKNGFESIVKIESRPAVGEAENFCSNLYRTKVQLKLSSGKILDKSLILKVFLKQLEPTAYKEMKLFFANEVTMYENILIKLSQICTEYNMTDAIAWPNCYFANTDLLVLDDLKETGYCLGERQLGYSLEESLAVIQHLAKLHALSFIADKKNIINSNLIRKLYTWVQTDNWTSKYIRKGIKTVGELAKDWGPEWYDIGVRLEKYSETINERLNKLFLEDVRIKVVNHGDCWVNNILIKYQPDGKTPQSVKFVDLQNATYNSYGWDLVYFLYTSLTDKVLTSNYHLLLNTYRNEFQQTLLKLNQDINLAPTLDEIKSEIVRLHGFCVTMVCTVMGIVFSTSEHQMQIDDLTDNTEKLRALYLNETFISTTKSHLKYFVKNNVF